VRNAGQFAPGSADCGGPWAGSCYQAGPASPREAVGDVPAVSFSRHGNALMLKQTIRR
jgi:hypothetical protein